MTSKYDIPDPTNVPPIIQDDPVSVAKIGEIIWLDSENQPSWPFSVRVLEEDTEQTLDARWRLVRQGEPMPAFTTLPPLPAGERERRLGFSVASPQLSDGVCHRLELAVSGTFWRDPKTEMQRTEPIFFAEVTLADDLALAYWTIWEGQGSGDAETTEDEWVRLGKSCGADESQLGNPSSVEAPQ